MKKIERPVCGTCFWWEMLEVVMPDEIQYGICHNTHVFGEGGESFARLPDGCWCDLHPEMGSYKRIEERKRPRCISCIHYKRMEPKENHDYTGKCKLTGGRIYAGDDAESCYLHEKKK